MNFRINSFLTFVLFLCAFPSEGSANDVRPALQVNIKVSVESDTITLGDIASIRGEFEEFGDLIEKMKAVSLGISPRPLSSKTLQGSSILDAIKDAGIPLEAFGYSIPAEVEIQRAGRIVTKEEVLSAARLQLHSDPALEIAVKGVEWDSEQVVPSGELRIEVESLGAPDKGKMPLRVAAFNKDDVLSRFLATALVDDWRSIPVVRGRLDKGSVIADSDIHIIRANLANLPNDVALTTDQIAGRRVTRALTSGSPISLSDVDIPPVIERGKPVKMIFKNGGFTASATGIATENGFSNSIIKIRNDRSNKIVRGKVISSDEVLVVQ